MQKRGCLKKILSRIQFLAHQGISFRAKVCDQNDRNLVQSSKLNSLTKKALKTHIKVLKIQKILWGGPSNHLMRGSLPPSRPLPSLVPSALDGLFCQTTFNALQRPWSCCQSQFGSYSYFRVILLPKVDFKTKCRQIYMCQRHFSAIS